MKMNFNRKLRFNEFKVFESPLKFLKLAGIWMDRKSSSFFIMYAIIVHLVFFDLFAICAIAYAFTVHNVEDFAEAIGIVPVFVGTCLKSLNITLKKQKIEQLLDSLQSLMEEDNWLGESKRGRITRRIAKIDEFLKIFLIVLMASAVVNILKLFLTRELPLKIWFPFEIENDGVLFWCLAICELLQGMFFFPLSIILDVMQVIFMFFLSALLRNWAND